MESEELSTEEATDETSSPPSTPVSLKREKLSFKDMDKEKNRPLWMCRPTLAAIAEEWNQVPTVGVNGSSGQVVCTMLITVDEAFCHLRSSDLPEPTEESEEVVRNSNSRLRWTEVVHWFRAPPKLDIALIAEFNLVLSIAQGTFDWNDFVHWRMLQTIYKKLTGAKLDCPQFGSHWQLVGFQGSDPSTDLRGVGLLGLLQFLYLATAPPLIGLSQKLYTVANSENQPFPLAVLSLNVTHIVLNSLRSSRLNRECNIRHSVFDVINLFYAAVINYTYTVWTSQNKTIKDSGFLLKESERYCCRNVRRLLRELPVSLEAHNK